MCLPEIFSSGFGSPVDSAFPESRKTSRDSTGVQKPDRESLVRHAGLQNTGAQLNVLFPFGS
ncbi:MAG: hypothetical protein DMG31_12185 [Acidobacteria bacterium]|nr:MAG: hypothetical protein DMG31_12185 [Acidobacteriota bacterium]